MPQFTQFQQAVIDYIITVNEGGAPPDYLLEYFQALEGGFDPSRRFILHLPVKNKLYLYYNAIDLHIFYMERGLFTDMCRETKKLLVDIAQFIIFLMDNDFIIPEFKQQTYFDLPKEQTKQWRRYQEFYPSEAEPILLVKSIIPLPTDKLYSLRMYQPMGTCLPS